MSIYVKKFNGFIADVANIDFKRCDGTQYHCDTATASAMTPSANSISITGGHSQYPIGFIDTDRGLEASFTNAMFDADMFEVSNASNAVDGESSTMETKKYAVTNSSSALVVEIPYKVETGTVYIRGLEEATEAAEGKFKVEIGDDKTTVTLSADDVSAGDEIFVSYERILADAHTVVVNTTTPSARGEVWMHWPVYSSGTDCTEAAVKGWVHVHIFRVRVTALAAIDSSYKTAATHQMTFTAIDPQRADNKMYEITYVANA